MRTDEFDAWTVSLEDRSIRMRGDLSTDAQRRLFSLIELPAADLKAARGVPLRLRQSPGQRSPRPIADVLQDRRKCSSTTSAKASRTPRPLRRGWSATPAASTSCPSCTSTTSCSTTATSWPRRFASCRTSKRQAGIRAGVRGSDGGGYYDGYDYGDDASSRAADRSQAKKEEMAVRLRHPRPGLAAHRRRHGRHPPYANQEIRRRVLA